MPFKPKVHRPPGAGRARPADPRPSASRRGYGQAWRKFRKAFLAAHPLCAACLRKDPEVLTPATVVDHVVPHKGDDELFWREGNHEALCFSCHSAKTARQDGGWGRRPAPGRGEGGRKS